MGEPSQGQGTATVASSTGTEPGPAGALFFVSGDDEFDEETIVWKIKQFAKFFEMSNEELAKNGITFDAGYCVLKDGTRTRATWKYHFRHVNEYEEDWFGAVLQLQNDKSEVQSAKATAYVSVSSGGDNRSVFKLKASERLDGNSRENYGWGRTRWFTKAEILNNVKETNALEVCLLVKVFSNHRLKPVLQNEKISHTSPLLVQLRDTASSDSPSRERYWRCGRVENLLKQHNLRLQQNKE